MQGDLRVAAPARAASWAHRPTLGRPEAHVAVLVLYTLLTVLLTWPTVTHLATAVPGPPDANGAWLYDLWDTRRAATTLFERGQLPAPRDPDLPSLGLANRLLALPFLLAGNEILAYNAVALLTFLSTAYAGFLLVMYVTGNPYAATVSGCILAFAPLRIHWLATGQLPLLSTQLMPLTFLSLERAMRESRRRHGFAAGVFLSLTMLSSWTYVVLVGSAVVLYTLLRLYPWKARSNRSAGRALRPGVLIALACVAGMLLAREPLHGVAVSAVATLDPSPSIDDLVTPSAYHPIWGQRFAAVRSQPPSLPDGVPGYAYLGLIAVLLALVSLTDSENDEPRTLSGMVWVGVLYGLFSLGPVLKICGEPAGLAAFPGLGGRLARALAGLGIAVPASGALPLPAVALYWLVSPATAAEVLRAAPIVPMLALAVMAGIGTATMVGSRSVVAARPLVPEPARNPLYEAMRPRRRRDVGALCGTVILVALVVIDGACAPLATGSTIPRHDALAEWLAGQSAQGALVFFPLERTVSGYTLYATRASHGIPARTLVATGPRSVLEAFPSAETTAFLRSRGVTYVVVDGDAATGPSGGLNGTNTAAASRSPTLVLSEEPVWEVSPSSTFPWRDPGTLPGTGSLLVYSLR